MDDTASKQLKAREFLARAAAAEESNDHEEAVRLYRAAFKLDPSLDTVNAGAGDEAEKRRAKPEIADYMSVSRTVPSCVAFRTFDARDLVVVGGESTRAAAAAIHAHLQQEGYVVIDNVLDSSEVTEALKKFTEFLEASVDNLNAADAHSVAMARMSNSASGIVSSQAGCGHSHFSWFVRSRNGVKAAFRAALFGGAGENEQQKQPQQKQQRKMISSFGAFNFLVNPECEMRGGGSSESWLHFDSTGSLSSTYCVQGVVNLLDATPSTEPSFVVFPRSHRTFFSKLCPGPGNDPKEFCSQLHLLSEDECTALKELNVQERAFRVPLKAGSAVLWYPSTMHCNLGCAVRECPDKSQVFRRVAQYVCMMPDPHLEEVAIHRAKLFAAGIGTTHQPDYGRPWSEPATATLIAKGVVITSRDKLPDGAEELL